jgi:hypothetical protein
VPSEVSVRSGIGRLFLVATLLGCIVLGGAVALKLLAQTDYVHQKGSNPGFSIESLLLTEAPVIVTRLSQSAPAKSREWSPAELYELEPLIKRRTIDFEWNREVAETIFVLQAPLVFAQNGSERFRVYPAPRGDFICVPEREHWSWYFVPDLHCGQMAVLLRDPTSYEPKAGGN